tara:strand:- start:1840 stop:2025 length:186 start_codon:yes stop_codon:yes gene_type:complete
MIITTFTKTFTTNRLKGVKFEDKITHPDFAHAFAWVDGMKSRTHKGNGSAFTVDNFRSREA